MDKFQSKFKIDRFDFQKYILKFKTLMLFMGMFFLCSCENIGPKPPQFCCKINGKQWTPTIKSSLGARNTGNAFYRVKNGFFDIYGSSEVYYVGITIKFKPNTQIELNKKYIINSVLNLDKASGSLSFFDKSNPSKEYELKGISGFIQITKMDSQYFSGTFEYEFDTKIDGKTYKIKKGEFNNMLYANED
jgi:hypothetical protein